MAYRQLIEIFSLKKVFIASLAFISFGALADFDFYGKINVSLEDEDLSTSSNTEYKNNASRIGLKGSYEISPLIKLSFQIEEEIDPTDLRANGDKVFKERNTFIAISGNFGKLFIGTYDTAFKTSQLKIDLFNDTRADIKYILHGENRMDSFVGYTSPDFIKGLNVTINSISQTNSSGESMALNYSSNNMKASFAVEQNLRGYDGERFAIMLPLEELDLGLLYQSSKKLSSGKSYSGHVISMKRMISNKGSIYIQNAESDMKIMSGSQNSIGYSHKINTNTKAFAHFSNLNKDDKEEDVTFTSIGFEYKF